MVSYNVRAQDHDTITFVNDVTLISGAVFSGQLNASGVSINGALSTTKTNTAATSGPYAPLGYISIQVSGNTVKVPFFTV